MSATFDVKLIQAEHGDAILISYGEDSIYHILVDGGPKSALSSLLKVLESSCTNGSLTLEAIVVTHYDLDHIGGIIALLEQPPKWLNIKDIWFNGHKHCMPRDRLGARHSDALARMIIKAHMPWNKAFHEQAVRAFYIDSIKLPGNMEIRVLSPTDKELSALAKQINEDPLQADYTGPRDKLGREDKWPPPPCSNLSAQRSLPDKSASNASSIALLLNYKKKQVLLAGDAHAELICKSLEQYWPQQRIKIDLLKVSHHGSHANTSHDFLRKIECKRFAFSTNGRIHAHPDQALIARIVAHTNNPQLIFNYKNTWTSRWTNRPTAWPKYSTLYPSEDATFVSILI